MSQSTLSSRSRVMHVETLETRTVLSANPVAAPGGGQVVHDQDPVIIEAIHLRVGDRDVSVTERNDIVVYESGESIDVVGIDYEVTGDGIGLDGLVAFEGYLREPVTVAAEFEATDDLRFTFINEQQYAWGFGLQNDSPEAVEEWAVQITNATYNLDADLLSNNLAFELTTTMNDDGTYNHLFVGTSAIAGYGGIPGGNIEWFGVNFGGPVTSDGFQHGVADTRGLDASAAAFGEFDYEDGRFGDPSGDAPLAGGVHEHGGLDGAWDPVDGTNRLSLALVRYFGDLEWEVHDRFFVNLQQGQTDLEIAFVDFNPSQTQFSATIRNNGVHTVTNYAEVDVYHESDLLNPVWVGVADFTLDAGKSSALRFSNPATDPNFDTQWTPGESGTYVYQVYLDPENALQELEEGNNLLAGKFEIL